MYRAKPIDLPATCTERFFSPSINQVQWIWTDLAFIERGGSRGTKDCVIYHYLELFFKLLRTLGERMTCFVESQMLPLGMLVSPGNCDNGLIMGTASSFCRAAT